ncbi:MAG: thiamine transport system ATP-binding protein [Paracoccaceae bacterium]|jgi:thiamine transport system ATP-binding protein
MLHLKDVIIAQGEFRLGANWSVKPKQKLAIIGPSGGGKSTLLSAISGLMPITSGHIFVNGQDVTDAHPAARPISLLFQDHNLFPHLTVGQNVGLGLRPDLKLSHTQHQAIETALHNVGLAGFETRTPANLSGGQRQRVALARALLRDKPLLMLDEPFAALGPALKAEMLELVDQIVRNSGATLLMVTHDPDDAKQIADVTSLVSDGVASPPQETKALFADPPEKLRQYLG